MEVSKGLEERDKGIHSVVQRKGQKPVRVAFTLIGHKDWTGGSHYLRNLLNVLHEYAGDTISPVLFVGRDAPMQEIEGLRSYVDEVVQDRCFSRWSLPWVSRQVLIRGLDRDIMSERVFSKHDIDVVFNFGLMGRRFQLPSINWIADFQHFHMPDMFLKSDVRYRNRLIRALADMSSLIVVSSECAKRDFELFLPGHPCRVALLNFIAKIPDDAYNGNPAEKLKGYNLPKKFFHLPNQFWKHKNHIAVIKALALLKGRNPEVFVVCTGNIKDYRNPGHFNFLKAEISRHGIEAQIALLGLVPFDHLFTIMRRSAAIINPSLFEGWSTTVEQAKSMGKKILLSDIPVHREQAPREGVYFRPDSPEDLAVKILQVWEDSDPGSDMEMESRARAEMEGRLRTFAKTFEDILGTLSGKRR